MAIQKDLILKKLSCLATEKSSITIKRRFWRSITHGLNKSYQYEHLALLIAKIHLYGFEKSLSKLLCCFKDSFIQQRLIIKLIPG